MSHISLLRISPASPASVSVPLQVSRSIFTSCGSASLFTPLQYIYYPCTGVQSGSGGMDSITGGVGGGEVTGEQRARESGSKHFCPPASSGTRQTAAECSRGCDRYRLLQIKLRNQPSKLGTARRRPAQRGGGGGLPLLPAFKRPPKLCWGPQGARGFLISHRLFGQLKRLTNSFGFSGLN